MEKIIPLFLSMTMMFGCATPTPTIITAKCPEPPTIERPESFVQKLDENSTPSEVMQAHRLEIKSLQGYAEEIEKILEGFR